ncbi:MAG: AI-2E family transporter [Acidobacteria bacterium]|nr:AI-2E family transporter [Acidobacteriota bacterium]
MNRTAQVSFVLFTLLMALIASLNLGTFLLTALFGYLALQVFNLRGSKSLSVVLYLLTVVVVVAGLTYFAALAYRTFPKIADAAIPAMAEFAEKNGIDLPFTDYASLKVSALEEAKEGVATIGRYARIASLQTILLLAGMVVALSVFLNPSWTAARTAPGVPTAYSELTSELGLRFKTLYQSFARVMGAQIVIAAINTILTAVFLIICRYPYTPLLLGLVFLCGLLPIVGNLTSNTVIVGVGFTMSPKMGLIALIFLVTIHKLEYFLNSKIIGTRIDSPMWLTLIGLVIGERLMGVPGMILAPVILHYVKAEMSVYRAPSQTSSLTE